MNEFRDLDESKSTGGTIINAGAVIAVLFGIPCFFMGIFGAVGVLTGQKLIAGGLGALWAYMAVIGAYELNRRKFDLRRGRALRDQHLLAGTLAVSTGLVISGVMHEFMPALAIVCVLSAIKQANDGHEDKFLAWIHAAVLIAGMGAGIWFYTNNDSGKALLDRLETLP
jgi:hypothetical protein